MRSDQGDAGGVEFGFEAGSPVALVGDQGLAGGVEVAEGDHVQAGVAFVGSWRRRARRRPGALMVW